MVFNTSSLLFALLIAIIGWLTGLSYFVWRMIRHYNRLTKNTTSEDLKDILDGLLSERETLKMRVTTLEQAAKHLARLGTTHIQRVGIVRFNPFSDTGGSQSFTLALLDAQDNGIVMTSLYARSGNRWYVKIVKKAKGLELDLSKEEQSAIKRARTIEESYS